MIFSIMHYGSDWKNAYHRHVQNWKSQPWNKRNHDDAIDDNYDDNDDDFHNEYESNNDFDESYKNEFSYVCLILSCTPISTILSNEESSFKHTRAPSSSRHHNHHYTVLMKNRYGLEPKKRIPSHEKHIVTHVPREAIRFSDKSLNYQTYPMRL